MRTYYQITAELYQEHVVPVLNAKQYDSGRGVDITLTDCGAVVVPANTDVCNLYCKKPDGTVSYISGTVTGDAVRVDFTNTLLAATGLVECELEVTSGSDTVSTPVFKMAVLPSNYDQGAIQSKDEFTALETALQTVSGLDGRVIALEATAATLGDAATYDVANNLTTSTAGSYVLDAAQGKALADSISALDGRIDDIGTVTEDVVTEAVATTTATYKSVASVAHGIGTYLVTTSVAFSQNTTGIRVAIVTASASSNTVVSQLATATAVPLNGYWTRLSHAFVIRASSAGAWHLKVYQNSGGNLNVSTACIQATKLSD